MDETGAGSRAIPDQQPALATPPAPPGDSDEPLVTSIGPLEPPSSRRPRWRAPSVGAFVSSFHPRAVPPMLRANYARELVSWAFLPVMLGVIEGGTVSIVVKKHFADAPGVLPAELNLAVAAVTAAPSMANITSFLWAGLAHGRAKVPFIGALQVATAGMVLLLAFAPRDVLGLAMFTSLVILARVFWTGVITIRTGVWRANYPHADRARIAGNMATVQSIILAATGFVVGRALDFSSTSFVVIFPVAAAVGLVGNAVYRRVRLRGQRRLARAERDGRRQDRPSINPMSVIRVLREDHAYRRFMTWMFVFGLGNLMISAPLAIILEDRLGVSYLEGILVTTVVPLVVMPLVIPMWARLLGRRHVVEFRAIHGWSFVLASALFFVAATFESFWLFLLASLLLGIGFAGGVLAWNLGHHDFAPAHRDGQYMGVHVTLTGIRGILAPFLAVGLYQWLDRHGLAPGIFVICFATNLVGLLGFVEMSAERRRAAASSPLVGAKAAS